LIGRIQAGYLDELETQVSGHGAELIVNLQDVTLVDVQSGSAFGGLPSKAASNFRNCPVYIQEWIFRKRNANT
jgi:hypothetical protein